MAYRCAIILSHARVQFLAQLQNGLKWRLEAVPKRSRNPLCILEKFSSSLIAHRYRSDSPSRQERNMILNSYERLEANNLCREPVGSLFYLSKNVRPDISCVAGYFSRYMNSSRRPFWEAGKQSPQNLKETKSLGTVYKLGNAKLIKGYFDSDWGHEEP